MWEDKQDLCRNGDTGYMDCLFNVPGTLTAHFFTDCLGRLGFCQSRLTARHPQNIVLNGGMDWTVTCNRCLNSYQHVLSLGIKLARLKAGLVPRKQCSVLLIELRAAVLSCRDLLKYSRASKMKQRSTSIFWGEGVGSVAFSCHLVGHVIQNPHTLYMAQL